MRLSTLLLVLKTVAQGNNVYLCETHNQLIFPLVFAFKLACVDMARTRSHRIANAFQNEALKLKIEMQENKI